MMLLKRAVACWRLAVGRTGTQSARSPCWPTATSRTPGARGRRLISTGLATCLCGALLAGCQTTSVETSDGRPMPPDPRPAPEVPTGAHPNALAMFVGAKATDSNGNGYPDLISAEVFLFSRPHPSAMHEEGRFIFALYPAGENISDDPPLIAAWHVDEEAVQAARFETEMLKGYVFRLSMLDADLIAPLRDRYPLMGANLHCRFEPSSGTDPVETNEVHWIQIGKRTPERSHRVPTVGAQ